MINRFSQPASLIFIAGAIASVTSFVSPPLALGLVFGLLFTHPFRSESRRLTRTLLQASVVALGFGMNLHQLVAAGRSGFVYTAAAYGQNLKRTEKAWFRPSQRTPSWDVILNPQTSRNRYL